MCLLDTLYLLIFLLFSLSDQHLLVLFHLIEVEVFELLLEAFFVEDLGACIHLIRLVDDDVLWLLMTIRLREQVLHAPLRLYLLTR